MIIELKNIRHQESLSEETNCFTADLIIDGQKIGTVGNRGTGGADEFHGDLAEYRRADRWCRENKPKWKMGQVEGETDLEMVCADLVEEDLVRRDMGKAMRRAVIAVLPNKTGLYELRPRPGLKSSDPDFIAACKCAHPTATLLNTLPEAEALRLFRMGAFHP